MIFAKVKKYGDTWGAWTWFGDNPDDGAFESCPPMSRAEAQEVVDEINRPERRDFSASPCDFLRD